MWWSYYNWYWLVDGLMEKGHRVHLANTAAIQQYNGLKYTDDHSDARWLAHLLRLGVLAEATFIRSKSERCVICCASGVSSCIRGRQTFSVSRV